MKKNYLSLLAILAIQTSFAQSGYVAGDFHQHSTYTDGSWKIGKVMDKNAKYGLDWWSNSEHGGAFASYGRNAGWDELVDGTQLRSSALWTDLATRNGNITIKGDDCGGKMWRWQSLLEYSYLDVKEARAKYADKMIFQGFEWNAPGHEHADVTIISNQFDANDNCSPVAEFEYKFDQNDKDVTGGASMGWTKSSLEGKEKTLEAVRWMQENYKGKGWIIPTHPERKNMYSIADFRNMNNAGPDVCFGFDSQPGHQKGSKRGGYSASAFEGNNEVGATWGGTGAMAARVGGLWDALLSEGRNWWLSTNCDFHEINDDFFPGEYQKTYTFVEDKQNPESYVKGLRSGNSFIVTGDLINELEYTINDSVMGSVCNANSKDVTVKILVCDPEGTNNNVYSDYNKPELDHIDLIAGCITGIVNPEDDNYNDPNAPLTKVIARFDAVGGIVDGNGITSIKWDDKGNGYKEIIYKTTVNRDMYFRLRGTNLGINVEGETDNCGNPMKDVAGENNATKAFSDLWFYSNPIFVKASTSVNVINNDGINMSYDNKDISISFDKDIDGAVTVFDTVGKVVKKINIDNSHLVLISTNDMTRGNYIVEALTDNGAKSIKKIQVK